MLFGEGDAELSIEISDAGAEGASRPHETHRFMPDTEPIDLRIPVVRSARAELRVRLTSTRVHNPAAVGRTGDDRDLILWIESIEVGE